MSLGLKDIHLALAAADSLLVPMPSACITLEAVWGVKCYADSHADLDHVQPAAGATLTRDSTCQIRCAAVQPPRGKTGYPFVDGYQCVGDRLWHMSFCQGSEESPDAEEFHDRRCPNACTVEFRRCRSPGCQHADAGECYEGCVGVRSVPMRVETGMARRCAGIRCLGAASSARVLLREAPPSLG
jgi:hypothetical protein